MEKLLKKLGIDASLTDEEILDALEKKQMEYLDRLDSVEDEERRKELKGDLSDIESTINSLSWSLKRRNSGISSDASDKGIMVAEEDEPKGEDEETLAEQMTNSGAKSTKPTKTTDENRKFYYDLGYKQFFGISPYIKDYGDAKVSFTKALNEDELTDEERGMALGYLGYILGQPSFDFRGYHASYDYNKAVRYAELSMDLGCPYGYYVMGFLCWNKNPDGIDTLSSVHFEHRANADNKKYFPNPDKEKAKGYFDKAIELGDVYAKQYMWYWNFDAVLEKGWLDRARYLAKNDPDAWYKIYKKTYDIYDVRHAAKKGSIQAQKDLAIAEKELNKEKNKQERKRKTVNVGKYIITFLLMLIPSFIVSFYGILRIIDDIFGNVTFFVIFSVWLLVDVIATVIWRRIFD